MSRIAPLDTTAAAPAARAVLDQVQSALGGTPAMFRTIAHSPAALKAVWGLFGALGTGQLTARLGEQIAVAVANANGCEYCLAAHTALGQQAGLGTAELAAAQLGESNEAATAAALRFALKVVAERGHVSEADVQAVRLAGFTEGQVVEILAHVALNLFTNYVNVALGVDVDFPPVALRRAA